MDFTKFIEWGFYSILTGAAVLAVRILSRLNDSISELNVKIAVIISRVDSHEHRISKLEDYDSTL